MPGVEHRRRYRLPRSGRLRQYGGDPPFHLVRHDLPIVVQIVDSAENVRKLVPVLEQMMDKGLIAISDVELIKIQKPNRAPLP